MVELLCEVCRQTEFKYKCPRCWKKTCSLQCSKAHKEADGCDGKSYDPLAYVSSEVLKDADDAERSSNVLVQRDYNFLIKMKRELDLQRQDAKSRNKRVLAPFGKFTGSKRFRAQEEEGGGGGGGGNAEECTRVIRRGVNCMLLPKGMYYSRLNKSKWDNTLNVFVWTIGWVLFPSDTSHEVFKYISHRAKETDSIIECIGRQVYDKCCEYYPASFNKETSEVNPESKADRTKILAKSNLRFYTKWFPYNNKQIRDSKKLIELPKDGECIGALFRNKTVLEFPTIYIALQDGDIPKPYELVGEEQNANTIQRQQQVLSDTSDDEPVEESSSKKESQPVHESDVDDEDEYQPGVTLDFLAD